MCRYRFACGGDMIKLTVKVTEWDILANLNDYRRLATMNILDMGLRDYLHC